MVYVFELLGAGFHISITLIILQRQEEARGCRLNLGLFLNTGERLPRNVGSPVA